ncbi:DUF3800 domain-containing protein [Chelatococcus sambhunathii]|uniref:DUF3800 domain-containing protein n=1 Tax=Chelatococcus sambhunathii TaxID=363953 RepID=A0ABU1DBK9_9HYPH|nr:DUF3800 domain-containing protein [Chelatococcus sambhunathii]MDR4305451.1 DUF3800 domain-containing protein [Chelatococcus sambhunathii]
MKHFTAYIDEAGDEGLGKLASGSIGGQSRWFVLGACIVNHDGDLKLPAWKDAIIARFPNKQRRDLHFRDLKHDQKVVVSQEIAKLPIGACVVMSHKATLIGTKYEAIYKRKGHLYNYLLRWMLERITFILERESLPEPACLKIVFSRRASTDYQKMKDYLYLIKNEREMFTPIRRIRWNVLNIEDIVVENHSKWAGLQIADCITSAYFSAVEPNIYGNYEPTYATLLKEKLLTTNGVSLNWGLTPVPSLGGCRADDRQYAFLQSHR